MKKFLFTFTLFFFSFFLFNNVKAISNKTVTAYYDGSFFEQHFLSESYVNFLDNQLIPYLDSTIGNNYAYVIYVLPDYFTNNFNNKTRISISPKGSGNFGMVVNSNNRTIYSRYYTTFPTDYHGGSTSFMYKTLYVNSSDYMTQINNFNSSPTWSQTNTYVSENFSNFSTFTNNNASYLTSIGNEFLLYYSNVDYKFATGGSDYDYFANYIVNYNGDTMTYTLGDSFPFYKTYTSSPDVVVQDVVKFDDNSFGFYQYWLDIINYNLDIGSSYSNSISCVEPTILDTDKPFVNNYCSYSYNNFPLNSYSDSDILDSGFHFNFPLGDYYNYLDSTGYYAINFRLLNSYSPKINNVVFDTTEFTTDFDIVDIKHFDRGSFIDYVVVVNVTNIGSSNNKLKNIDIFLESPISLNVSNLEYFNLSVYRSFKLKYYSSQPNSSDLQQFVINNDLTDINSSNSDYNFFLDTDFDTFGFAGIVSAPFRFLYKMKSTDSCSDIELPFPNSNRTFKLVCFHNIFPSSMNPFISLLRILLNGLVCYYLAVNTLKVIKELLEPDNSIIEVVDL